MAVRVNLILPDTNKCDSSRCIGPEKSGISDFVTISSVQSPREGREETCGDRFVTDENAKDLSGHAQVKWLSTGEVACDRGCAPKVCPSGGLTFAYRRSSLIFTPGYRWPTCRVCKGSSSYWVLQKPLNAEGGQGLPPYQRDDLSPSGAGVPDRHFSARN